MAWTLRNSFGVEKATNDWGITGLTINRDTHTKDVAMFNMPLQAFDADETFPYLTKGTIFQDGVARFAGVFTKPRRQLDPSAEMIGYELVGPWYFLEQVTFQMMWQSTNGITADLVSTTRSRVILGRNTDNFTKMNLGQVMTAALNYALSATPQPGKAAPFFTIGAITPDIVIPYAEVTDKSCAELINLCLRWVPDAVTWFDYSHMVGGECKPQLNIVRRGALRSISLPVYGGRISKVPSLVRRDDLVRPAVIVKYEQVNTVDGAVLDNLKVDKAPVDADDNMVGALVATIDLTPGNATYQRQTLKVTNRPKDYNSITGTGALTSETIPWVRNRVKWLKSYVAGPDNPLGGEGTTIEIAKELLTPLVVITTLADNADPLVLPSGTVQPGGGPGDGSGGSNALDYLGVELLEGTVADWIANSFGIQAAHANIEIKLTYTGDDPVVLAYFSSDDVPTVTLHLEATITNASSQEYAQETSLTPAETAPVGLAQKLLDGLSVPHYEGNVELTEEECSNVAQPGMVLNLTGGRAEWTNMNAVIIGVSEDITNGRTTVKLGVTPELNLDEWMGMRRAAAGRIQTWHLNQQQTAQAGDNAVRGIGPTPKSGATAAPVASVLAADNPFACSNGSEGGTCKIIVKPGQINGDETTGSPLAVGVGTGKVYVQFDFTYDSNNTVTKVSNTFHTTTGEAPPSTVSAGSGSGSGTFYRAIANYTATVTNGKAIVKCDQLVSASMNFGICNGAITGPWFGG